MATSLASVVWLLVVEVVWIVPAAAAPPPPPASVTAVDRPWDGGTGITIRFPLSTGDSKPTAPPGAAAEGDGTPTGVAEKPISYQIQIAGEYHGLYTDLLQVVPTEDDRRRGEIVTQAPELKTGRPYWFRVMTVQDGVRSAFVETGPEGVRPTRQWFDGRRFYLLLIGSLICSAVIVYIILARSGRRYTIRKIAGLDAMEDAVGRATEMGRACLFVPGVNDINEIQTVAGLTILSRIGEKAADYDCVIEVPTSRSLVMTAAQETLAAAYFKAGRPDAYREDAAYYVTDEQFGYVAHLTGKMVREKPAACFYMGSFFAESLILAETGNAIGAIQIAGTAQPSQLPFFVAACDYTLIGEEFFAASAYLSNDPDQLGTLKGQDFGKYVVAVIMVVGIGMSLAAALTGFVPLRHATDYLRDTVLGE